MRNLPWECNGSIPCAFSALTAASQPALERGWDALGALQTTPPAETCSDILCTVAVLFLPLLFGVEYCWLQGRERNHPAPGGTWGQPQREHGVVELGRGRKVSLG